jgi:MoxR-like ATPase
MKPSEVAVSLTNAYQAQTPMFVWGPPGVGKSDVMRQVAAELGVNMIDQRLSQMKVSPT